MKTTDEMILDLHEKAGFVLPEGLWRTPQNLWVLGQSQPRRPVAAIDDQLAHDLCAMEFARQAGAYPRVDWELWCDCMIQGDSAAAIKALWEGVCGGTNES